MPNCKTKEQCPEWKRTRAKIEQKRGISSTERRVMEERVVRRATKRVYQKIKARFGRYREVFAKEPKMVEEV